MSELPKDVQKNKIDHNCYHNDDVDDDDSIIYSPEKPISLNSNNVSKKCIQIFFVLS